jgi:hypothetical protein
MSLRELRKICFVNHNRKAGLRAVGLQAETIRNNDKEDCISNNLQAITTHARRTCTGYAKAHALAATPYEYIWKASTLDPCPKIFLEEAPSSPPRHKLAWLAALAFAALGFSVTTSVDDLIMSLSISLSARLFVGHNVDGYRVVDSGSTAHTRTSSLHPR